MILNINGVKSPIEFPAPSESEYWIDGASFIWRRRYIPSDWTKKVFVNSIELHVQPNEMEVVYTRERARDFEDIRTNVITRYDGELMVQADILNALVVLAMGLVSIGYDVDMTDVSEERVDALRHVFTKLSTNFSMPFRRMDCMAIDKDMKPNDAVMTKAAARYACFPSATVLL
jgi:hypothetical protein